MYVKNLIIVNLYSCFCKEKSSLSKLNDKINFLEIKKSKFSNNIVLSLKKQDNSFSNFLLLIKLISTHYFFIEKSKQSDLCIIILLSNRFLIKILVKELILLVL